MSIFFVFRNVCHTAYRRTKGICPYDIMSCCVWERVYASVYTAAYQAFRENSCLRKNLMDSDVLHVVFHEV